MMQVAPIPSAPVVEFPEIFKSKSKVSLKEQEAKVSVQDVSEILPEPHILNELSSVDRLMITKRLGVRNMLTMRGKKNRFMVRTPDRNLVYTIEEENRQETHASKLASYFCYGLRPLQLRVSNCNGQDVMMIRRPFALTARVLPCQLQTLEVFCPPGHLMGTVQQQWTAVKPLYLVVNARGEPVFWIRGPTVTLSFFRDVQFQIQRTDGSFVGATCKRWQGLIHALFFAPVTDRFGVAFDRSLSVEEKGLLMAVTLLMDYMYYDT